MSANATAVRKPSIVIVDVPVDGILASPSNPRKTFKAIDELAENIQQHGIKVPLRVRPIAETENASAHYELVFGERRWRAAKKAGLTHVPAIVEEMSDAEALELMLVELAQTSDVHPVEEAEAYRELHDKHGLSVDEIAAKVGKSKRVVYERMQLTELAAAVKEAALEGRLPQSHAVLIARVPVQFQEEALKEILRPGYSNPMTHEQAREYIVEHYTLGLAEAPWDLKDESLIAEAGSCTKCPKRSGNQPELFADIKAKDTCTDPPCFTAKKKAFVQITIAKAVEEGRPTMTAATAKKSLKAGSAIDLDDRIPGDGRTYREAIGKKKVEVMLAPAPEGVKELVATEEIEKALGKQKEVASRAKLEEQRRHEEEKDQEEMRRRDMIANTTMVELIEKMESGHLGKAAWFVIAEAALEHYFDYGKLPEALVLRRLKHEPKDHDGDKQELHRKMSSMTAEHLAVLVVEMLLLRSDEIYKLRRGEKKGAIRDLCSIVGVDEKKIAKHVDAELKATGKPGEVPPEPGEKEIDEGVPPAPTKKKAAKKAGKKAKPASKKKGGKKK